MNRGGRGVEHDQSSHRAWWGRVVMSRLLCRRPLSTHSGNAGNSMRRAVVS